MYNIQFNPSNSTTHTQNPNQNANPAPQSMNMQQTMPNLMSLLNLLVPLLQSLGQGANTGSTGTGGTNGGDNPNGGAGGTGSTNGGGNPSGGAGNTDDNNGNDDRTLQAAITGSSVIKESSIGNWDEDMYLGTDPLIAPNYIEPKPFTIKLDEPAPEDMTLTIKVNDGQADNARGLPEYRDVLFVNGDMTSSSYGDYTSKGSDALTSDFTLYDQNGEVIEGDTIEVNIRAGQTESDPFFVQAWEEVNVAVNGDDYGLAPYREDDMEDFSMEILNTQSNTGNYALDTEDLTVRIQESHRAHADEI